MRGAAPLKSGWSQLRGVRRDPRFPGRMQHDGPVAHTASSAPVPVGPDACSCAGAEPLRLPEQRRVTCLAPAEEPALLWYRGGTRAAALHKAPASPRHSSSFVVTAFGVAPKEAGAAAGTALLCHTRDRVRVALLCPPGSKEWDTWVLQHRAEARAATSQAKGGSTPVPGECQQPVPSQGSSSGVGLALAGPHLAGSSHSTA